MSRLFVLLLPLAACTFPPSPPTPLPWSAHAVSSAAGHTLVLTDLDPVIPAGTVETSGTPIPLPEDPSTQAPIALTLPTATAVAAGAQHACIISTGQVTCWGEDDKGALGAHRACASPTGCALAPGVMPTLPPIRAIAAGTDVTCAITTEDRVLCWGQDATGKLGGSIVSALDPPIPVAIGGKALDAMRVAIRDQTVCALASDGSAWCWGEGYGATPTRLPFDAVDDVSVNADHGCAIAKGVLSCWGNNINGQSAPTVATDCTDGCSVPATPVPGAYARVVVGARHTCALGIDQTVTCWGSNEDGQLGGGDQLLVGGMTVALHGATAIDAGTGHSCAVKPDLTAWCWGDVP